MASRIVHFYFFLILIYLLIISTFCFPIQISKTMLCNGYYAVYLQDNR